MTYSFSYLQPICCSTSGSNCCLLTYIQISQEAGQVVRYSHLSQNFPQFIVIHTVKGFGIVDKAEIDAFLELSYFLEKRKVSKLQGITSHKSEWPSSKSWQTINNKFWRGYGEKGNSKLLRSVFIPIPKKANAKEYWNYHTIVLISHGSKVMLKILQARLQQYVNRELPDVQAGF